MLLVKHNLLAARRLPHPQNVVGFAMTVLGYSEACESFLAFITVILRLCRRISLQNSLTLRITTILSYTKLMKVLLVTINDHLTRVTDLFRGWPTFFSKKR